MTTENEIRELKQKYGAQILRTPGVAGVGIERGDGEDYVLAVHLSDPSARERVKSVTDSDKIRFVDSGPFKKLDTVG